MTTRRVIIAGAILACVGTATSGPLGFLVVSATHPQPGWRDAATFANAYHPIQVLPYALGFLLVGGMIVLIAGLHARAPRRLRARSTIALVLAAVFAAMIFTNYAVQTTLVPALVRQWDVADAPIVAALTMTNPRSLGWALEMWGYAVLGVATWLCAPVLRRAAPGRCARFAATLFSLNAPVSIASAVLTAIRPDWVQARSGIAAFAVWNAIVLVMTLLTALAMRDARNQPSKIITARVLATTP